MSLTDQNFQFLIVNHEVTQTFAVALSLCIQKQIVMYHRPDSSFHRKSQTLFQCSQTRPNKNGDELIEYEYGAKLPSLFIWAPQT